MTVLHLSNTDRANGKAVKIRFRGAANSDDVMDFQIFLSPGDIWTGAISQGANNVATLYTADNTCTVPQIPATGADFMKHRLPTTDNGNGTREGYVEIFNMADIPSVKLYHADGSAGAGTDNSQIYTAIKHVNGVAPCSVASSAARTTLNTLAMTNFTDPLVAAAKGFGSATTGLSADWYILNLNQTTNYSGAAAAVEARVAAGGAAGAANFVHFPQSSTAADMTTSAAFFAGATTFAAAYTADPLLRKVAVDSTNTAFAGPAVPPLFVDLPDMSTPYVTAMTGAVTDANLPKVQAAILTNALARTSVSNQYALDPGIKAATDWVLSMPTRRYSVAANYKATTTAATYRLFSGLDEVAPDNVTAPTASAPGWFTAANTTVDTRGNICAITSGPMQFFDREEQTPGVTLTPIFSPAVVDVATPVICGEAQVLSFSSTSVLGSSPLLTGLSTTAPYMNGWALINTSNAQATAGATNMTNLPPAGAGVAAGPAVNVGLPIVGDAFIKVNNDAAAGGFTSTFGITWTHRYNQ